MNEVDEITERMCESLSRISEALLAIQQIERSTTWDQLNSVTTKKSNDAQPKS